MFKSTPKTVASVTAGLSTMVDGLVAVQAERLAASEAARAEVARLEAEVTANDAEAARANLVAERIRNLLG